MSVFLSSGSPRRSVDSRRLSESSSSSWIDSWTSRREPAQQTWPWLKKMPLTMPSTAWSIGASSKTMLAPLPPSSRVTFLSVPAIWRAIALPTAVEPVKATLLTSGCATSAAPVVAVPGKDVDDALGQARLAADVREEQRGQRGRLGGLQDHRVAGGERRGDLPREHQQREVPGDDLAGHAERARVRAVARVVELVGPARVVEEVRGDQREVRVAGLLDRLAVVEGLQDGQLARALLDDPGDPEEVLGALGAGQRRPLLERLAGRLHGAVHVLGARLGDLGEDLLGGRARRS